MYHMKNILSFEKETVLPECMYSLKNPVEVSEKVTDINISEQVTKFLKKMPINNMHDLEERQDKLLHKLDILYERIKTISSLCKLKYQEEPPKNYVVNVEPEEIVLVSNYDNLPWFLNVFLKSGIINVTWHIHSTVPHANVSKIHDFFTKYKNLYRLQPDAKINFRLIFKNSTTSKLKTTSLAVPILGTVNIIRYLCLIYKDVVPYDYTNHEMDALLDILYELENSCDKNKQSVISKSFLYSDTWIYKKTFSIVDLAVFNIIKELPSGQLKHVSKQWFCQCENMIL